MGLDMTAYTTIEKLASEVDFDVEQHEVLHYWCKHANLHGWMEQLYFAKGGRAKLFNCANLALNGSDLLGLEQAVRKNADFRSPKSTHTFSMLMARFPMISSCFEVRV